MAFAALTQLNRKRRQVNTLRLMLHDVEELLGLAAELGQQRELTTDEQNEAAVLEVRRDRIKSSLVEAGA